MADSIGFTKDADRSVIYSEIAPQIEALTEGESDTTANLANIAAVLKEALGFYWVGFYIQKDGELVLGPFQGTVACTRIGFDEGVCGHSYSTGKAVIVPNVDEFPGHIACSSESKSELVLPVFRNDGSVFGVLDVDSNRIDDFSEKDRIGLERIVEIIGRKVI